MLRCIGSLFYPLLLLFMAVAAVTNHAQGQDPGLPDSVILAGDTAVAYNPGSWSYHDVGLYCVTDDSILFANIPLKWTGDSSQIFPSEIQWENVFGLWEHFAYFGNNRVLLSASVGFGHSGPSLFTNYLRESEALIRFAISPTAVPQIVVIDTVTDSINGKIELANIDVTFRPKFRGAFFRYGEIGQSMGGGDEYPSGFNLNECYPNPFNSSIKIDFELRAAARCRMIIYDILGREIAYLVDGELGAGHYSVAWDGKDKSGNNSGSGVYFVKMNANEQAQTRRITLIR